MEETLRLLIDELGAESLTFMPPPRAPHIRFDFIPQPAMTWVGTIMYLIDEEGVESYCEFMYNFYPNTSELHIALVDEGTMSHDTLKAELMMLKLRG